MTFFIQPNKFPFVQCKAWDTWANTYFANWKIVPANRYTFEKVCASFCYRLLTLCLREGTVRCQLMILYQLNDYFLFIFLWHLDNSRMELFNVDFKIMHMTKKPWLLNRYCKIVKPHNLRTVWRGIFIIFEILQREKEM